jgi:nucleotide sugar dehydrogenase
MMKKVGIVGYGYVGRAMHRFFGSHYDVLVNDINVRDEDKGLANFVGPDEINGCDLSLICVPTPSKEDGGCDVSMVDEVVSWIDTPLVILKSTVEIGTTDRLSLETSKPIVFSPEYCGESRYWSPYLWDRDVKEMPFFIFGGKGEHTSMAVDFYAMVAGPVKKYVQTTASAAEMAKYMENSFYATKILFCYEMAEICVKAGIDYNSVRELWLMDPRINPMHTAVFSANDMPFSGKCLPKDIEALRRYSVDKLGYDPEFLKGVIETNNKIGNNRKKRKTK